LKLMIYLRTLLRIYEKKFNPKKLKNKNKNWLPELLQEQKSFVFGA
jgi:hypothetical protein